jgi:hypothetical protein
MNLNTISFLALVGKANNKAPNGGGRTRNTRKGPMTRPKNNKAPNGGGRTKGTKGKDP